MAVSDGIAEAAEDLFVHVRWMSGLRRERLGGVELCLLPGAGPVFAKVGRVRLRSDELDEALDGVRARLRSEGRTTSTWRLGRVRHRPGWSSDFWASASFPSRRRRRWWRPLRRSGKRLVWRCGRFVARRMPTALPRSSPSRSGWVRTTRRRDSDPARHVPLTVLQGLPRPPRLPPKLGRHSRTLATGGCAR